MHLLLFIFYFRIDIEDVLLSVPVSVTWTILVTLNTTNVNLLNVLVLFSVTVPLAAGRGGLVLSGLSAAHGVY